MYADESNAATLVMLGQTVGLPLLLTGVSLLLWWMLRQRFINPVPFLAAGVLFGFWAGSAWIRGRLGFPPTQALDLLVVMGLVAVVLEVVPLRSEALWSRVAPFLIFMGLTVWMLYPILSRAPVLQSLLDLSMVAGFYLLLNGTVNRSNQEPIQDGLLMMIAAGAAPVIALGGTLLLGQMTGVLATCLGVLWLAGLLSEDLRGKLRVIPVWLITGLFSAAYFYADVDGFALGALVVGLLIMTLPRRSWPAGSNLWDNLRLCALGILPLGLALWLIWPQESMY
jgi:hypothetical protein